VRAAAAVRARRRRPRAAELGNGSPSRGRRRAPAAEERTRLQAVTAASPRPTGRRPGSTNAWRPPSRWKPRRERAATGLAASPNRRRRPAIGRPRPPPGRGPDGGLAARLAALEEQRAEDEAAQHRPGRPTGRRPSRVDAGLVVEPRLRAAVEAALGEISRAYLVEARPSASSVARGDADRSIRPAMHPGRRRDRTPGPGDGGARRWPAPRCESGGIRRRCEPLGWRPPCGSRSGGRCSIFSNRPARRLAGRVTRRTAVAAGAVLAVRFFERPDGALELAPPADACELGRRRAAARRPEAPAAARTASRKPIAEIARGGSRRHRRGERVSGGQVRLEIEHGRQVGDPQGGRQPAARSADRSRRIASRSRPPPSASVRRTRRSVTPAAGDASPTDRRSAFPRAPPSWLTAERSTR